MGKKKDPITASCLLGADGRVLAAAAAGFSCGEGAVTLELPDGFDRQAACEWCYVDGVWTHRPEVLKPIPGLEERIAALEAAQLELLLHDVGGGD